MDNPIVYGMTMLSLSLLAIVVLWAACAAGWGNGP